MDRAKLGRTIERYLRGAEDLVSAWVAASSTDADNQKAMLAYERAVVGFDKERKRHSHLTQSKKVAALANDWLDAYQDVRVLDKLPALLMAMQHSAEVAALSTNSPTCRHNAVRLVAYVSFHCFIVLGHACEMVELLPKHSSSSAHKQAADRTLAALWNRGLVDAVAAAAPSLAATIALVHSETGKRELYGSTTTTALTAGATEELSNCLVGAGHMATAVNRYLYLLAESLYYSLKGLSADGGPPALLQLPPEAVRALEALGDSQLLAAAATVLVDSPAASVLPGVRAKVCNRVLGGVQGGSKLVGVTLFCMQQMRWTLDAAGGPESRRLAGGLLRAMRHVAVRRLQAALLDQLAAHAGMGAELREDGSGLQGGQAGEEQQAGSVWEGGGWEGSIGVWWFAREEAQRGQLLALDPVVGDGGRGVGVGVGQHARNDATGLLEDRHCHIVYGAFGTWGGGVQEQAMAAAAGVPAGPPPLLAARLAARAAEALCRLCRGQGLGGAYAPAPRWQFAMAPVLVLDLLPVEYWDSLPAATARVCAPYWLEAAGWLTALMSDATAAAMGRLPAVQRPDQPRSYLDETMVCDGSQAKLLAGVVGLLQHLANNDTYGFKTLPATAQADVLRWMARCGLAASLDHTLRLLFSAQDLRLAGQTAVAKELGKASLPVSRAIEAVLERLLPLMGGQAEGADSGGADGPQLGLLLTLSKRAAMLACSMEAGARADDMAAARQQWVERAAEVLVLLTAAAGSVEGGVRSRVAAEAAGREAAATGSGTAGDGCGVGSVDEAHEALALAARAASSLAAALAWEVAADVGTAATGGDAVRGTAGLQAASRAVCDALACAVQWWRHPPLLPPAQLLACQPQRLLAAVCALAMALPGQPKKLGKRKQRLCVLAASAVAVLSAHGTVSGRARDWLAPPPAAAAAGSGDPGGGGGGSRSYGHAVDPCAGCLAAPLLAFVRHTAGTAPPYAAHTLALLRLAGGSEDTGAASGEADGGFRRYAQEVAEAVLADGCRDLRPSVEFSEVPMPDGSSPSRLLQGECGGDGPGGMPLVPPPPPPTAGALPPPLALQPSRQGALPRLRVCGNPRCGNFAGECEGELPFKQCGGCRAVRYCGADCQRAHWREGHRAECKLLAAET